MQARSWLPIMMALAACGEDDPPPAKPNGQATPAAAAGGPAANTPNAKLLTPQIHIEDRVVDPAEKASLRHPFKDRDFAVDQNNRDPFQSFVVILPGMGGPSAENVPLDKTKKCTRDDQMIASSYTYADLKLVGIIAQGTQRKVLMMDPGNLGHVIKRGDCVGKEKAVVKDIGTGYVTFLLEPDEAPAGTKPSSEEHSVQLYPNQMPIPAGMNDTPSGTPATTVTPVVPPPPSAPRPKGPAAPIVEQPPKK